jgi:GxxExxY protein
MTENEITDKIIGCSIDLHKILGPGLLESVYEGALAQDLREAGLTVRTQVAMPFVYKQIKHDVGFRIDMLVDEKVVVEVKSVESLAPVHFSKTLTYLKLGGKKVGLLINFNTHLLKDGLHRLVNNF